MDKQVKLEEEVGEKKGELKLGEELQQHQPPNVSAMEPLTREAYGGGMYGAEPQVAEKPRNKAPASETQSADGPTEPDPQPKHRPPPSTGDRDLDITGQSYIQ
ncbi:uncharacterized protein LOC127800270 [Diospyros lotus]|uniref:uncharacterized protein LOC127800270 n=1 Tax=Diospyros lotus TaxID=55363 RepID=UPI00225B1D18|nr:uncharacterized protein LOC127800270 [Diospyros lotus]